MGTVISIEAWRKEHDPAAGLEHSVEALDRVLRGLPPRHLSAPDIERDLLAITGAVSLGLLEEAASRADRLRERLERRARKEG